MKNKVLYIISDHNFGGGSRHLYDLICGLNKKIFAPILISIPSPILDRLKNKIKTYTVEMKSRLDFNAIKKIREIIKLEKPDIIHLHSTRAEILGTMAAKNLGIPIIYTEHLFTDEYIADNKLINFYQIMAFKHLAKYITQVVAVSESVKQYFINKKIFSANKIEVIYHGIDTNKFFPAIKKHSNSQIIVGSIGTLTHIKGFKYLINAVQNIDNVKLEIMGVGAELEHLKKLDVNNKTKFLGYINDPQKIMNQWDIYAQPSLSESFGLGLAEAMAQGLPSIATKTGGMPELVGDAGILVEPKDTKTLTDAIIKLAQNPKLCQKLGNQARIRIIKNFSLHNMVKKTEKLYEKIITTSTKLK
ncbi:MAG: glycosyltransferase family 4 protein [Patescibacteria group bacterium]|nr:glycosyltransferase family 4 protein [Patescibacteria group bacterium]